MMKGLLHKTFLTAPLQKADISLLMEEDGNPLLHHKEKHPLIPASNMKLITSAAALLVEDDKKLFPPLQTFCDGEIKDKALFGNLILDSCGSLIFSARFPVSNNFKNKNKALKLQVSYYVKELKKAGIHEIKGNILLSYKRWNAHQENKHYTAAAAFSYNENTVDTLVSDRLLKTIPDSPRVFQFSENKEIKDQDKIENNLIRYNPSKDSQDYWRISQSSATEYALKMLKQEIEKQGIKIRAQKLKPEHKNKLLFETNSLFTSAKYIEPLNKHSDNFRAELLALLIARMKSGKASYEGFDSSIKKVLKGKGLNLESLNADDGSGLSRKNRLSTFDINKILKYMGKSKFFEDFLKSFSLAAKYGTLKKRFTGTPWEASFFGKTGTLNGVSSLSGYWVRRNKPLITFSFIGNNAENKVFWEALEKFAASLKFMA